MNFNWIGWAVCVFIGLTIISGILGGTLLNSDDVARLNNMGITQTVDISFFTLTVPNMNFFTGFFQMFNFQEYDEIFGGMAQLIVFALYSVTYMVFFFLVITLIGIAANKLRAT